MTVMILTKAQAALVSNVVVKPLKQHYPGKPFKAVPLGDTLPNIEKGDVILAMGNAALKLLEKHGLVPKNRSVTSLRGSPIPWQDGHILLTFDPSITLREPGKEVEISWDTRLAGRLAFTGSILPNLGEYRYVQDFQDAIDYINAQYEKTGKPVKVATDLETLTLNPYSPATWIVSISFTYHEGQADLMRFTEDWQPTPPKGDLPPWDDADINVTAKEKVWLQLQWLFTTKKVSMRGANLKYDQGWTVEKWGLNIENFRFDTTLVGSLIDENRSNSLNTHAKLLTTMGGYDDCVAPETLVCTWDLRWVPIGEVEPGDRLLGFDEESNYKQRRRMRVTVAESTKRLTKPGYEIRFSDGTLIRCSHNHGFLAFDDEFSNGPFKWVHAEHLEPGYRALKVLKKLEPLDTWEAGYLSGLYDGEGYVSYQQAGMTSGLSQNPGPVWDTYKHLMQAHGLGGFYSRQKNTDGVMTSKHTGAATLQMLQLFRPQRLINKIPYDGKCIPSGTEKVWVEKVTPIGDIEVVSLQTSTHTFVAEGLASHNSFNKTFDKSRMDLVPDDDLLIYAGGDTDACYRVADQLAGQLMQDKKLLRFYVELLHPASNSLRIMERNGCLLDVAYYAELQEELEQYLQDVAAKALENVPALLKYKYADNLSPTRPKLVKEFLFTKKGLNLKPKMFTEKAKDHTWEYASTKMEHLQEFKHVPEAASFIECLSDHAKASKTLSTYVTGFLKHLRPDGKLHASGMLYKGAYDGDSKGVEESGTVTGRLAFKDPAVQTIPKHTQWAKKLRKGYIAPPGYKVVQWDYSQGELRITACVANEKNMIKSYNAGIDLHLVTGCRVSGYDFEDIWDIKEQDEKLFKFIRQNGKAGNFGLIYGMSAGGYAAYAHTAYGVEMTLAQATAQRDGFFELYPGLIPWHMRTKAFAKKYGYVRSPLGRVRHLPHIWARDQDIRSSAERQSINSPVQATLSDLTLWSQGQFYDLHGETDECLFCQTTHDSLVAYVREDRLEYWCPEVQRIMENLPLTEVFGWTPQVKFAVDIEVGDTLADLDEWKPAQIAA